MSTGKTGTWSYAAVPESVPRARAALTEFAHQAGADGEHLDSIRLAASEAISNVVMHAYPGGSGSIQICASVVNDDLWILVSDEGGGLRSDPGESTGLGLGLVLIARLAADFQLVSRGEGGTELRMRFGLGARRRQDDAQPRGSLSAAVVPA